MSLPGGDVSRTQVVLLAALDWPAAMAVVPEQPRLRLEDKDDRPTWERFSWWLAALQRIDPGAIVGAGVVIGERLLALREPESYGGEFSRVVEKLREAWWAGSAPHACLSEMAGRITELNEAECALDSGGEMPVVRVAARALTQLALEFTGGESNAWLANAIEGLQVADHSLDAAAIEAILKAGLIRLVLSRQAPD